MKAVYRIIHEHDGPPSLNVELGYEPLIIGTQGNDETYFGAQVYRIKNELQMDVWWLKIELQYTGLKIEDYFLIQWAAVHPRGHTRDMYAALLRLPLRHHPHHHQYHHHSQIQYLPIACTPGLDCPSQRNRRKKSR